MTEQDAVNLLLALHGADNAKEACIHVVLFRHLEARAALDRRSRLFADDDETQELYEALIGTETFGPTLETVIRGARLLDLFLSVVAPGIRGGGLDIEITRLAASPIAAHIRLWHREGGVEVPDFERWYGPTAEMMERPEYPRIAAAERQTTGKFGIRTICALHRALFTQTEEGDTQ
jgi:hypothetical protein